VLQSVYVPCKALCVVRVILYQSQVDSEQSE
jgi:hypothetical protein